MFNQANFFMIACVGCMGSDRERYPLLGGKKIVRGIRYWEVKRL